MHKERGFTFVEVMMSMLVLVGGMLMVAHSMTATVAANYRSKQQVVVSGYVQQKIESLKAVSYVHSDLSVGTHSDTPAQGFTRTWTVTSDAQDYQKTISLNVSRTLTKKVKPVSLTVMITRVR